MPDVSVVVPTFNAAATLPATLRALAEQDLDVAYEVIVVDDGSEDESFQLADQVSGMVRAVRQAHAGPAAARNRGVEEANGRFLAFTDADCVPEPDWLRQGVYCLERADLVQGKVVPEGVEMKPFDRTIVVSWEYGLYQAANLFVTAELFEAVGGFEDWLPVTVGKPLAEDVWFGWRARRLGARTAFCEHAVVEHAVFRRRAGAYIEERARLMYFPAMVAKMPELRDVFLYHRWFLNARTAKVDAAVLAVLLSMGPRRLLHPSVAAVGALPYLRALIGESMAWGRRGPAVLTADFLADAVGFVALALGTLRFRSVVL